jgi:hypothetical protein
MVDPTITKTCPCGTKVSVNQLGQHLHTDCEFDPTTPGCCGNPCVTRIWSAHPAAGTRCKNCGKTWGAVLEEKITGMASHLVDDWNIEMEARRNIVQQNRRAIAQALAGIGYGVDPP